MVTYSPTAHLENLGPLRLNSSGDPDSRDNGLPVEAKALLDTISNTESAGSYNVTYGGARFNNFG